MTINFYKNLLTTLQKENSVVLMVVIASEGSSPGRKGFKMFVTCEGIHGTIGGGIMEHKLVEYAQSLLQKEHFQPFIKHQIHDKSASKDQSGMICSGEQTIAFYDLDQSFIPIAEQIISTNDYTICYSDKGISIRKEDIQSEWYFSEKNSVTQKVYLIGGGHVGLALSELLSKLDFEIHLFDHRENLNTMNANDFVASKRVVDFNDINNYIPESEDGYVIIMSFGYRTDDIIIRKLIHKNFKYIGMLGSKEKIKTLFANMIADGFDAEKIKQVHAPIGIDIKSETTYEIAVSIAAQLIKTRNQKQ